MLSVDGDTVKVGISAPQTYRYFSVKRCIFLSKKLIVNRLLPCNLISMRSLIDCAARKKIKFVLTRTNIAEAMQWLNTAWLLWLKESKNEDLSVNRKVWSEAKVAVVLY
ncbi:hypothetical protein ACFSQ7_04985 [Paenibacillus rhizoplanae]